MNTSEIVDKLLENRKAVKEQNKLYEKLLLFIHFI
jgi:hypothetical protein